MTIELNDEIFGNHSKRKRCSCSSKELSWLTRDRELSQQRQEAEVRGGGRKPFRQKGTGRHRQGSSTDPSQVGGGVVFAPKPRDYRYTVT